MGIAGILALPPATMAQSAGPGAVVILSPLKVEGVETSADEARRRLEAVAGGIAVIDGDDLLGKLDLNLADTLATVPGVVVQTFFGGNDQPRIQIRGSGLQQNPVERGILALKDGLPLNRADGSYIVGLADVRGAAFTEIYRGYTANRLGATVLGGAFNLVSPTGSSAPGATLILEGGSFGQLNARAQVGQQWDRTDAMIAAQHSERGGYRDYNQSERTGFDANVGLELTEALRTRFFAGYTDLGFDVAGPTTEATLNTDPRAVHTGPLIVGGVAVAPGPNIIRDKPRRETEQYRIGNRTTASLGPHLMDVAAGYAYTDDMFRFPVSSGVRVTEGGDLTLAARYAYAPVATAALPLLEATATYVVGSADREYYLNNAGRRGALFGKGTLDSDTLTVSAGANIPLGTGVTLSPAIAVAHASRDFDDTYDSARRPTLAFSPANPTTALPAGSVATTDTSYARNYSGFTPSLGLSWRPNEEHMLFGAISRGFEPPTHDDLLATVNGTPNSSPGRPNPANPALAAAVFATPDLDAQRSTTVELGWRGHLAPVMTDAVIYYSWVEKELLNLRDATGVSLGAINADETRHFGIELGVSTWISDSLSGRIAYTYQDFRFHDDPLRQNNRLAGAPRHILNAQLGYQVTTSLHLRAEMDWWPGRTPVDNMNTLYMDSFITADLGASYAFNKSITLYGEVRNLFDTNYASSTLIVDQAVAGQAAFLPADGRAFYTGLKVRF